ncbi:MAG TPA: Rne/Rng family ribonuclease [Syntrophales bacterium]|nr:Rne/Rng family ribonuclease [Syntrophales bacterium]
MKHHMLVNAVHQEQKRMATVDEHGKLLEFNIQMSAREPITGNIYKGVVLKVERGLQAAFVNYGGQRDGFLPLRDVNPALIGGETEPAQGRHTLKVGQEILIQVVREEIGNKGALLTGYISLPGRYLVLLPYKESSGISRKIEDEEDRKRLKELVAQVKIEENMGFIIRTAGYNRTKQELSRDYNLLSRLWQDITKTAQSVPAPALIYQESDFGVRTLRDYFTPEIEEILVDNVETFRKMRAYCKAVAPRNVRMIKNYKEKTPLFDKYNLEEQIRVIYQERVNLKSGGYIIINPTEAMITIDVNSGRASNKRNVEETAFNTNIEAAEEIARQLRLRDLGGLIVIDFIDMIDKKHQNEVEKSFKKALSLDRSRIQLSKISKFGLLELSRQKKQSTIQEISYTTCPFCNGSGVRPSLEYTALSAFRKLESQAVKGQATEMKVSLPHEVANYLLNQKRTELCRLESNYGLTIHISGSAEMNWDGVSITASKRDVPPEQAAAAETPEAKPADKSSKSKEKAGTPHKTPPPPQVPEVSPQPRTGGEESAPAASEAAGTPEIPAEPAKKKSRRRPRRKKKRPAEHPVEGTQTAEAQSVDEIPAPVASGQDATSPALPLPSPEAAAEEPSPHKEAAPSETGGTTSEESQDSPGENQDPGKA